MFLVLQMNQGTDVFATPLRVQYDPKIVKLVEVLKGNALSPDGQKINFTPVITHEKGEAKVDISRLAGSQGVSSSGPVVLLKFQGVAKGTSQVTLPDFQVKDSKNQPITATAPSTTITVE